MADQPDFDPEFVFGQNMAQRVTKTEGDSSGSSVSTAILSPVKMPKGGLVKTAVLTHRTALADKLHDHCEQGSADADSTKTNESQEQKDAPITSDAETGESQGPVYQAVADDMPTMSSEQIFGHSIPKPKEILVSGGPPAHSGSVNAKPFGGSGLVASARLTNPFASAQESSRPASPAVAAAVTSTTSSAENGDDKNDGLPDSSTDPARSVLQPPTLQISKTSTPPASKASPFSEKPNSETPVTSKDDDKPTQSAPEQRLPYDKSVTSNPVQSGNEFRPSLASPKFSPFARSPFSLAAKPSSPASKSPPSQKPLLRPSALDAHTANWASSGVLAAGNVTGAPVNSSSTSPFILQPAKLGNSSSLQAFPTLGKMDKDSDDEGSSQMNGDSNHKDSKVTSSSSNIFSAILKQQQAEAAEASPVAATSTTSTTSTTTPSGPFVFGQNLQSRVVPANSQSRLFAGFVVGDEMPSTSSKPSTTNTSTTTSSNENSKTLSQAAAEYQAKQSESKLSEKNSSNVDMKTGEEDESNVIQITCKLYVYTAETSTWVERGRGFLRLNDMPQDGSFKSRLVMRAQGSLRLVLNTQVWAGMTVERANSKSLRMTCLDEEGKLRVYLIQSNLKDTEALLRAMEYRIQQRRRFDERQGRLHGAPGGAGFSGAKTSEPPTTDDTSDCSSVVFGTVGQEPCARRAKKRPHPTRQSPQSSLGANDEWEEEEVSSTSKLSPRASSPTSPSSSKQRASRSSLGPLHEEGNTSSSSDHSPPGTSKTKKNDATEPLPNKRKRCEKSLSNKSPQSSSTFAIYHSLSPCSTSSSAAQTASHLHRSPDSEGAPSTSAPSLAPVVASGGGRNSSASESHQESGTSTPPDPETEASNESYTSSITTHSLSE